MNILNVTPQSLKNNEAVMRNAMQQRMTGANLSNHLAEARRRMQEKQEVVTALRSIIMVTDAAKYVSIGMGAGSISADDYRSTLAKNQAELERFENVVAILEGLSNKSEGNHGI